MKHPLTEAFPTGISQPAIRALASVGFTSLEQLAGTSEGRLAALHGMGPKALDILKVALKEKGFSFSD